MSKLKVLDFSADNDHEPDSNGELTGATLDAGFLPESFTICSAIMTDAWTTVFTAARTFNLRDDKDESNWGYIILHSAYHYTEYYVKLGPVAFRAQTDVAYFPLEWTRVCLSLDSTASKVRLVVDGQLLAEEEYKKEDDKDRPANLRLMLGYDLDKA